MKRVGRHGRVAPALARSIVVGEQDHGLDVGVAVADEPSTRTVADRREVDVVA